MSKGWSKAQKLKFLETMKRKKEEKNNLLSASQENKTPLVEQGQTPAVDLNHLREYNFRRGLVTAMECILRELR
jgi:hypothetical protein